MGTKKVIKQVWDTHGVGFISYMSFFTLTWKTKSTFAANISLNRQFECRLCKVLEDWSETGFFENHWSRDPT